MRKFTLFIASLFLALGAMAQITDANQLSNEKCYHITSKDANRGAFYAPQGAGYLTTCAGTYTNYPNRGIDKDRNSTAQQFAFVEYEGKLYLWSVSEKKFAQKDGNFIKLVKTTTDFVTVTPNGSYFNINIKGTNKLNFSGGYEYGVYANYQNDDDGNNLVITEAGSFDPTETIAALKGDFLEDNITLAWNTSTTWADVDVANYSSTVFNENALGYGIKCIQDEVAVGGARTATVRFDYTSGNCGLNIRGVEVIDANDNIVAGDYHVGKAGAPSTNNVYTVKVAEAGTYKVRCYATFGADDRANATNGRITISFAKENTANFSHDVEFKAEYATLHLGYKVEIPEGVKAYVAVSTNNGYVQFKEVTGVIPAATPVLLEKVGDKNTYKFAYTDGEAASVETNLLKGSIENRYVHGNAYVLGYINEKGAPAEVGFGKAVTEGLDEGTFLNNANKAYLYIAEGNGVASYSFRFEGEGTTGISEVKGENGEVKAIFDLTGRRIEEITTPGIYIVNGKKVLVK